jgi:hypothetical protein
MPRLRGGIGKERKQGVIIDIWAIMLTVYAFLGGCYILTEVEANPMFVTKMSFLMLIGMVGIVLGLFMSPLTGTTKVQPFESGIYGEKGLKEETILVIFMFIAVATQFIIFFIYQKIVVGATIKENIEKFLFYTSASVFEEYIFTFFGYRFLRGLLRIGLALKQLGTPIAILFISLVFTVFHSTVYGGIIVYLMIIFFLRIVYCIAFEISNERLSVCMILHFVQNMGRLFMP